MKIDRLIGILSILLQRDTVTAPELAAPVRGGLHEPGGACHVASDLPGEGCARGACGRARSAARGHPAHAGIV